MAERLSKVYGTEMDKVNCPFFYKIGACRYGDSCERIHNKPPISETVMLEHMYENNAVETGLISGNIVSPEDAEQAMVKFETFFDQVFKEMSQYGEIQDMIVVDNLGDHIVGNVYVKYSDQEYSENAQKSINGRFFNGKKINAIYSPVTDFLNAKCKQYIDGSCKRGGFCNYMHVKPLSKSFKKDLFTQMYFEHPEYRIKRKSESEQSHGRARGQGGDRKEGDRGRHRDERSEKRDVSRSPSRKKHKERKEHKEHKEHKERKEHKEHKENKEHKHKDKRGKEEDRGEKKKRGSQERESQQRRNMIDDWNKDYYK